MEEPPAEFAELLASRTEAARSVWRQLGDVHLMQRRAFFTGWALGWVTGAVIAAGLVAALFR